MEVQGTLQTCWIKAIFYTALAYTPEGTLNLLIIKLMSFLKHATGHLDKGKAYLALDRAKVSRGKATLMSLAREKGEQESKKSDIQGIFFDGRKEKNRVLSYDYLTKRYHQRNVKENHISVTSEPDGKYRTHFTPGPSDKRNKPAEVIAQELHSWLVEHGIDERVQVLGGDSTNEMTGWLGGAIVWVERLLGRKCFWVVCNIHTNKLPLRHLIIVLDGDTNSKDGFSGPIGEQLSHVNTMKRKSTFEAIPATEDLIKLPEKVVKNMSTDAADC